MRARAVAFVYAILVVLVCSSAAGAILTPSLAGLSSSGFPAALVDPGLFGEPISSPDAFSSLDYSALLSSFGQSVPEMSGPAFAWSLPGLDGQAFGLSQVQPSFNISDLLSGQDYLPAQDIIESSTVAVAGTYDYSNKGDTIRVKLGDTIRLELPARIDQGYIWNLTLTDGLNMTNERVDTPQSISSFFSGMSLTNLEVKMVWDIKAVKTGTQVILGSYKGPDDQGPYDDTYRLTVIVE